MLPDYIAQFIQQEAGSQRLKSLRPVRDQLSQSYSERSGQGGTRLNSQADRQVYRLSRLPAIYAVIESLGREIQKLAPDFNPSSLLDLGAGPGTVALALQSVFSQLQSIELVEQDREQLQWGQALFRASKLPVLAQAHWQVADLNALRVFPSAEMITLSYVLNELPAAAQAALIARLLAQPAWMLLLVEPGTPAGYRHLLAAREQALKEGWHILGPCPHEGVCPLSEDDWCHFAVRVQRSQAQRYLKDGFESYEDEKFSWLALCRAPSEQASGARIIRRPVYRKGVVDLHLCKASGEARLQGIARSHPAYKAARKADWGDALHGL
ncbi:hypothetical protein COW36_07685 [bacterium (Candidatus Blackallbacteria) CG17_big_fil_post_rev_8_21_14_2_50_48_46]|uniref:rRNA methyltransferase n=1 Tax=bacterium (Candidatus Blackallbacteria) CG17_big_fil_post_rev_8_21_14_2_50_48_46 TaxID=2014261 RepID=A0A2M7G6P9_9BACT|nr:MAG: hypothetical protein COW64_06390 [bacterium (Candidatus Blackallbacteria) CG18_big_fil_WC_8_21_14_2_50_49_26]PIW17721.1 MAG: hypothetical protein COW36_07685 [bacterium (Candidatus Blackallbacteria) CG17_big_fil_post_rev_8_21_14_2_50_48_46]PIW47537.1 MAG: hypothetical protein COW20_12430 [bacterium (Candidatus Blackallbacteria) CG13_big_fil_rev_8_21_14_2_50_49_14]